MGLITSPEKSTATLLTPQPIMRTPTDLDGTTVPLEKQPRILGVTHDTMYTFAVPLPCTLDATHNFRPMGRLGHGRGLPQP